LVVAVSVDGLGFDGDVSTEEWPDDEWDVGQDEGLEAVGVMVTIESGVEGKAAGLAFWGELLAVFGGDQGQEVLGIVVAGTNVDGEAGDWEAGKWETVLDHLDVNLGTHGQLLEDFGVKVNLDLGSLLGHNGVWVQGQGPWVDIAVILESWAGLEVGLGGGHGGQGKNQGKSLHLQFYIFRRYQAKDTCPSVN